jgi:RNA polymerase sigma factor (sigma-70 family)
MQNQLVGTSLIHRLREGTAGQTDWAALYRQYEPPLHRLGVRKGLSADGASNLAQEVLIKVFRGIRTYNPSHVCTKSFEAWLYKCAKNARIDRKRKRDRERRHILCGIGGSDFQKCLNRQSGREAGSCREEEALYRQFINETLPEMLRQAEGELVRELGEQVVRSVRAEVEVTSWRAFLLCDRTFFLCDRKGFHAKEIAPFLGMLPGAVHRAASRVRNRIRQAVGQR